MTGGPGKTRDLRRLVDTRTRLGSLVRALHDARLARAGGGVHRTMVRATRAGAWARLEE